MTQLNLGQPTSNPREANQQERKATKGISPGRRLRVPFFVTLGLSLSLLLGVGLHASDAPTETPAKKTKSGKGDSQQGVDPDNLPAEMTISLDDLLNDPEGVAPDREATRCIPRRTGLHTKVLDAEHLLFRRSVGGKAWLNRLSPGCLGLNEDMVLRFEGQSARFCQLDRVQGLTRQGFGISSGRCSLGKFEPITELHAQALEDTFKLRSKEMAEARRQERIQKRADRRKARKERRAERKAARDAAST